MLFLFRSAPEVEKRIHSKLFRNFLEEPGYKRAGLHYCKWKPNVCFVDLKVWCQPAVVSVGGDVDQRVGCKRRHKQGKGDHIALRGEVLSNKIGKISSFSYNIYT